MSPMTAARPPFDESIVLQLALGDRALARRYLNTFVAMLPKYRSALLAAYESGDFAGLRDHAHQLAGAAAYCGALALNDAAKALDRAPDLEQRQDAATLVTGTLEHIDEFLQLGLEHFD